MTRRRALTSAAVVVAVAVAVLVSWRRCAPAPASPRAAAPRVAVATSRSPAQPAALAPVTPPPATAPEPLRPIIDQVIVERDSVCDGEESLITVKAHTPGNQEDAFLHYMIGSELGASVPLRVFANDDTEGVAPGFVVRVFGRDNVTAEVPVPPIHVRPCKPARRVHLVSRLLPNSNDEFELVAKVVDVAATTPLQPVEARWQFGDGSTAVSAGPVINHAYSARAQDTLYSQFLVTCEVVGANGERAIGRTSLQLLNPAFEHLAYKRIVLLFTSLTPRFPEVGTDGVVRQRVHLWHRHREPVRITRVLRYPHDLDTSVENADPDELSPVQLFKTDTIGPQGVDAEVELSVGSSLFSYEYAIEGESSDGYQAAGAFSVMRPPDRPTKDHNVPVVDPLLKAKILRAREVLHQAYVTDEDLYRLAARGAFDDLIKAAAEHPEPMQTPPPLPPR